MKDKEVKDVMKHDRSVADFIDLLENDDYFEQLQKS